MTQILIRQKSYNKERNLYEYDILAGNVIVGFTQLRLDASKGADMPAEFESNIYYEIKKPHRNQGFATKALKLVLSDAARLGLRDVMLTVNKDNVASQKIIKNLGGIVEVSGYTTSNKVVLKYRIKL